MENRFNAAWRSLTLTNVASGKASDVDANNKVNSLNVNSCEYFNQIYLFVEIPGMTESDIRITMDSQNVLSIKCLRNVPTATDLALWKKKLPVVAEQLHQVSSSSDASPLPDVDATHPTEHVKWMHIESPFGVFERKLQVPSNVDLSKIVSVYMNGILCIALPLGPAIQPVPVHVVSPPA